MMYHHRRRFLSARTYNHTCYPFCDTPLRLPPPPPPPPLSDSDTSPSSSRSHRLSNSLLLAASLLSAAVLLVLTFFAVIRRRRRRHHRQLLAAGTLDPAGNDDDDGGGGGGGGGGGDGAEPLHHAWYIRTVGLDDAAIASIPVAAHRGGVGGGDCSVCLGEFRDGELVRLLPKCAHPFHLSCIDTWLRAHVTCPLCRSPVVEPPAAAADDPSIASIPTPIAAAEADAESDPTQSDSDDGEASHEGEEEEEEVGEIENRAAILDPESDCPDSPLPGSELQAPIYPLIGRSVSMDSPHVAGSVAPGPEERELNSQEDQIVTEEKEKDLRADLSKAPATSARLEIERSPSSSARGFFFSRHGRARSSILPL